MGGDGEDLVALGGEDAAAKFFGVQDAGNSEGVQYMLMAKVGQ